MFKSPPIIILLLQIADAIDISSGVSPEDGIITSLPSDKTEFGFIYT